jgi:hypothetical protein
MPRGRPKGSTNKPKIIDGKVQPLPQIKTIDGTVQPLPQTKIKNGYAYTLHKRSGKVAIYKMKNIKEPDDKSVAFEVFRIAISPAVTLTDRRTGRSYDYPVSEKFPSNEDFGQTAWAYQTEKAAINKFQELNVIGV